MQGKDDLRGLAKIMAFMLDDKGWSDLFDKKDCQK